MRKIIVLAMITLDGVIQAPGGPEEDTSGNFKYGGWVAPYEDEVYNDVVRQELQPADYILGRKTFDIWAPYWPKNGKFWPSINEGRKYIVSNTLENTDQRVVDWNNTVVIKGIDDIKAIKSGNEARDLHVWGSSEIVKLLLQHDLVDELRVKIHPLILGKGKKLFGNDAFPSAFKLVNNVVTPSGVIIAHYEKDGSVETGDLTKD